MSTFYFMAVIFPSLKSLAPYLETSVGGEAWKGILDKLCTNLETALGFQGVRVGNRQERTRHELQSPPLWSVSRRGGGVWGLKHAVQCYHLWNRPHDGWWVRILQGCLLHSSICVETLRTEIWLPEAHSFILSHTNLSRKIREQGSSKLTWELNKLPEIHTLESRVTTWTDHTSLYPCV